MKNKLNTNIITFLNRFNRIWYAIILINIITFEFNCVSQSLDDELGVGKTDYQEASPETKKLWETVLETFEKNDIDGALPVLQQFYSVKDFVEPYQKTFTSLSIQILTNGTKPKEIAKQEDMPQQQDIIADKSKIEEINKSIQDEENKIPDLNKKIKDASTGGAVLNLLNPGAGNISAAGKEAAQKELDQVNKRISDYKTEITDLEQKIVTLGQSAIDEVNKRNKNTDSQAGQFRQKIVDFLINEKDNKRYRSILALSSLWLGKIGQDDQITSISQAALDMQKTEAKAITIAKAASAPANDFISQGRIWDAKSEIDKAVDSITNRITDKSQLEYIQREMHKVALDIDSQIKKALKKKDNILDIAKRDANEAVKEFEDFKKDHPDYPNYDQDKLTISDLKSQQVEKKFAKKIAAIEEVIPNDPEEAKAMIKKMFDSDMDEDEVSILKSKVVKLNRDILDQEVALITKDLNEAQSFLTKESASYAQELKENGKATMSFTQTLTAGTENIVRARSLQAGGIKRIEVLLTEEMDTVTKSKLVGLLETQKAALEQMDGTLGDIQRNKMIAMIGGCILALLVIVGIVLIILKVIKKK